MNQEPKLKDHYIIAAPAGALKLIRVQTEQTKTA